jgi:hypothetical protein
VNLDDVEELRPFVRDGKVVGMPRRRSKRLALLDCLAQWFEPGTYYSEADVNEVLRAVYPDCATLRRYLVDDGFLDRDDEGAYWRSGGAVTD